MRSFASGATRNDDTSKPDFEGFVSEVIPAKIDDFVLRERDLAWAGGLFEGEGYIGFHQNRPQLQVKMCDEDTLRKFHEIMGVGKVYGPYQVKATANHKPKKPWRPYFSWQVRADDALLAARLVYPYLGCRRQATLREKWGVQRLALVGGISPLALEVFGRYMHSHRRQADGTLRASNNWKKGIPIPAYASSLLRHVHQVHLIHNGYEARDYDTGEVVSLEDALCGVFFNAMGWLHELKKTEQGIPTNGTTLEQI